MVTSMDIFTALLAERAARRRWQLSGDSTHLRQWLKASDHLARCRRAQAQRQLPVLGAEVGTAVPGSSA